MNTTNLIAAFSALFAYTMLMAANPARGATTQPASLDIAFTGGNGALIHGTLLTPADSIEKVPAMILLQGSGPTDRDDNQLPQVRSDLLKQLAETFAAHGIASLRFDKRGMDANKLDAPRQHTAWSTYFTWENFTADAVAANEFLRGQPKIDPSRIGYCGHSEGAMLALAAAKQLREQGRGPFAIVMINTLGRSGDIVIAEQLAASLKRTAAPPDIANQLNADVARINKQIIETGVVPDTIPPALTSVYPHYLGPYLQTFFTLNPCKLAATCTAPVLLIASGRDLQTSVERDGKPLDAALRGRKLDDHQFMIVPNASHFLKAVTQPDDFGFTGPVVPEALTQIWTWTTSKL